MPPETGIKTHECSAEYDANPSISESTVIAFGSQRDELLTEDMFDQKQEDTIGEDIPEAMFHKPPPRQFTLIMIALSLCVFLASLDQIIVSTAIPAISREFNSLNDVAWLGTAYLMTSTAFQPLYGKVSDIFGRKLTVLFANFVFLMGSAIAGWATSMTMLIIGRGVAGIGGGGLMAMVFIILSDMLDMRERGKYIGIVSGIFSFSAVIGPLLGGAFTDHLTWRWSFWINMPFGAISIIFIIINLDLPTPKGSFKEKVKRIDFYGSILLLATVILILLPLSWGGSTYAWNSGIVIGLLCASVVVGVIFVLVEWKVPDEPIVPIHLYKIRNIWATFSSLFFGGMTFFGLLYYLPIYFQVVKGESATIGGLEAVPFVIGLLISSMASGIWAMKKGTFSFFPAMGTFTVTTGSALCILLEKDTKRVASIFILLVCGFGIGLTLQASTLAVQSSVKPKYMATVTASVQFVRSLGQVFGVAIVGSVFNNKLDATLIESFPNDPTILKVTEDYISIYTYGPQEIIEILHSYMHGLHYVFYCCVAFSALSFIMSCFIQHQELKTNANQTKPETSLEMV